MQKPSLDCRKTKSLPSFRLRPNTASFCCILKTSCDMHVHDHPIQTFRSQDVVSWHFMSAFPSAGCSNSEAIKGFPAQINPKRKSQWKVESTISSWIIFGELSQPGTRLLQWLCPKLPAQAPKGHTIWMLMIDVATLPRKICWTCPMYEIMKHVICNFIDLPEIAVFLTSKLLLHCTFWHRYSWCHFWGGYAAEKPQPVDIADLIQ